MKQTSRTKTAKQFSLILNKYHLTKKELNPELLDLFPDLIEALTNEIIGFKSTTTGSTHRAEKLELLMEVFTKEQEQNTLNILAKKLCLLFMLLRRMLQEDVMDEALENVFQRHINAMLKQDIPALASPPQKRGNSINKLYNYIRELSGSKQKQNSGKTTLEGEGDRGALKQILSGIFQPFCCYLLRMLQNHEPYQFVLRRNCGRMERPLQWAMVNSAKALGQIILQLHRFGRYFINDLKGILIYLTYLASKDTALYYDALMAEAERQAAVWRIRIGEEDEMVREGRGSRRIMGMSEFKESKGFIDQLAAFREKIHYIFGNKYLKDYRFLFAKPKSYELRVDSSEDLFEPILDYHRRASKWHHSQSLSKMDPNQDSFLFLAQTTLLSSKDLSRAEGEDFDVHEEELQYKLATTSPSKPRMNSWLSRAERNKHARVPAIICDKEDIISTNE